MLVYALTQRRSTSSLKNVVPPQRVQNSRSSAKQRKSFGEDIVETKSFDVASERLARTTIVYVSHQLWIDAAIRADSTQSRFVDDGANDVVSEAVGVRQGDRGGADRCPLPGAEDSDGDPVDLHVLVDQGGDLTLNPCGLLVEGLTVGDDHGDLSPVDAVGVDEAGVLAVQADIVPPDLDRRILVVRPTSPAALPFPGETVTAQGEAGGDLAVFVTLVDRSCGLTLLPHVASGGVNWGYNGSGPRDAAEDIAAAHAHRHGLEAPDPGFKRKVAAHLCQQGLTEFTINLYNGHID